MARNVSASSTNARGLNGSTNARTPSGNNSTKSSAVVDAHSQAPAYWLRTLR
ncbi:hypothetical protein [Streptomyces gossypii]|uniref:hypothetical protein n=1 Tax=Streptomyces gossypii TaxID=2883101 RepID=UPI0028830380|nr:hypothetical protein [Streptomyces gossypii]